MSVASASLTPDASAGQETHETTPQGEVVFASVLLAVILAFLVQALQLPMLTEGTIGPGFFPACVSGLLAVGLAIHIFRRIRRHRRQAEPVDRIVDHRQLGLLILVILSMMIGLWLGLVGIIAALLLAGLLLIDRVSPLRAVMFTAGVLLAVYLIFDLAMGMNIGLNGLF